MSLHPAFQEYLDWLNPIVEQNAAAGVEPTPESARAALAGLNEFALAKVPIAEVFDARVPATGGPVPVRVYTSRSMCPPWRTVPDTPSACRDMVAGR